MSSSSPPVFRILPTTQHNEWGKIGSTSTVAQFALASNLPNFHLDETKPYAEVCLVLPLFVKLRCNANRLRVVDGHPPYVSISHLFRCFYDQTTRKAP